MTPLFYRLGNGGWVQQNNNSGYGLAPPARTLVRRGGGHGREGSSGCGWFQAQRLSPVWIRL